MDYNAMSEDQQRYLRLCAQRGVLLKLKEGSRELVERAERTGEQLPGVEGARMTLELLDKLEADIAALRPLVDGPEFERLAVEAEAGMFRVPHERGGVQALLEVLPVELMDDELRKRVDETLRPDVDENGA